MVLKLPIWITRERPSKAASLGVRDWSRSLLPQCRLENDHADPELSAVSGSRCAVMESVAPVGLWMPGGDVEPEHALSMRPRTSSGPFGV